MIFYSQHLLVPKAAGESEDPDRKYVCSHPAAGCSNAARRLDHLKEHKNTHTKANLMRCPICIKEKKPGYKRNNFSKESNSTECKKLKHPEEDSPPFKEEEELLLRHYRYE